MQQKTPAVTPFSLNVGSGFGSRADDVFGALGNIEAKHDAFQKARSNSREGKRDATILLKDDPRDEEPMMTNTHSGQRHSSPNKPSDFHNCQFKRPRALPPKRGRQRDSDKWTYYNLSDVSKSDMSERSNTAAAMSFLRSRQEQNKRMKTSHEDDMDTDSGGSLKLAAPKHLFKKCSSSINEQSVSGDAKKPSIQIAGRPGCRVLPEYVVGQKPSSKRHEPSVKKSSGKSSQRNAQVSIGHLMDEEDEDKEDEEADSKDSTQMDLGRESSSMFMSRKGIVKCQPAATRTIFSGCSRDDDDEEEEGEEEKNQSSVDEGQKFTFVSLKNRNQNMRRNRDEQSTVESGSDEGEPGATSSSAEDELDLDGID